MEMLTRKSPDPTVAGRIAAACAWFPVTDLRHNIPDRDAAGLPLPPIMNGIELPSPSMEARLLGVADVADASDLARAASPVAYAADASGPVLLIHGNQDGLVNAAQSRRLHEALTRAGADSQLLFLAGADHQDEAFHSPAIFGAVTGFFAAALT